MTRIRNHPTLRDFWPLDCGGAKGLGDKYLVGERADATFTGLVVNSEQVTFQVSYEGNDLRCSIPCDDQTFRERLHAFLSKHIGLSIPEIGDLEIDF